MSRFSSLLLAAGRGTRLRPLTDHIPKPALPLLDVPLGAYGLADLEAAGGPMFVNLSPAHELVRHALSPFAPGAEFLLELPVPYGSAGTLRCFKERFAGPVVTRNADLLTDASVLDAISAHVAGGAPATIVTQEVSEGADLISRDGRAVRFVDRRAEAAAGDLWLGVSVLEREVLELIGPELPRDLASGLLTQLIERGEVAVVRHDGYFMDVGTIERYLAATEDVLYGRVPVKITEPGDVVEVEGGLAYVGPGASVPLHCLRAGGVVLAGAEVTDDAIVERAIVWPNERVPAGTYVTEGVWAFGALQR